MAQALCLIYIFIYHFKQYKEINSSRCVLKKCFEKALKVEKWRDKLSQFTEYCVK